MPSELEFTINHPFAYETAQQEIFNYFWRFKGDTVGTVHPTPYKERWAESNWELITKFKIKIKGSIMAKSNTSKQMVLNFQRNQSVTQPTTYLALYATNPTDADTGT